MNIKQLEAFVLIADHKSFTKAAKLLYMTQPGISFQIKALETQLDITLIERQDKKVILTEAGEILYPEAKKILAAFQKVNDAFEELQGIKKGKVKLGASNIPGDYLMPKCIGEFKKRYSGIDVGLIIGDTGSIIHGLIERELDIGVIGAKVDSDILEFHPLAQDELILIVSSKHQLAEVNEVDVQKLLSYSFVMREAGSGTRMVIEENLSKINIQKDQINISLELGSTRAVITAVEADLGISIVSRWAVQEALKLGKVKEVKVKGLEMKRYLYIATNKTKYYSHAAKAFLEYLNTSNE